MKTIDVCLSPDLMHLYPVKEKTVVVVDILRATSCMTTAFAHGVKCIRPFASLEECRAMKEQGYFTTAERDGKKVDGFDLGNSPFEYMDEKFKDSKIAFTTTNGTHAIARAKGAKEIVVGSFLNLTAVGNFLQTDRNDLLILCAGWKGRINLEDTLFAGALVEMLGASVQPECDGPLLARTLYHSAKDDLYGFLQGSTHVKRLEKLNIHEDIRFCLTPDQYSVVPMLKDGVLMI